MENLNIEESKLSPRIEMNVSGDCKISGVSRPEDPKTFFKPVFDWLDSFFEAKSAPLNLSVELNYFNTSSSKVLLDIFEKLEENKDEVDVKVVWIYKEDDDELMDAGEELLDLVEIEYELREV